MSRWTKLTALCLLLVLSACGRAPSLPRVPLGGAGSQDGMTVSGPGTTPLRVELGMASAPRVGQEVEVRLKVASGEAVNNVEAGIILPAGVEVVSGQAKDVFDLSAGQSAGITAVIRFTVPGQFSVSGEARSDLGGGTVWSDLATLQLTVGEQGGAFGFVDNPGGPAAGVIPPAPIDCTQNPASCLPPPTEPTSLTECPPAHSDPAGPVRVAITIPAAARVNEVITGTLVVCSTQEARQVQVRVELPQGVRLAQGDPAWITDIAANQPVAYSLLFSFASEGEYQVGAALSGSAGSDRISLPISVAP